MGGRPASGQHLLGGNHHPEQRPKLLYAHDLFAAELYNASLGPRPGGYLRYVGEVNLPQGVYQLNPGKYFFGIRLVSTTGRNFMASTGDGTIYGNSMGIFKSAYWGYPNWIPINQFATFDPLHPYYDPTDFAFQVYATPEPATWLLLTSVVLVLRRRSR